MTVTLETKLEDIFRLKDFQKAALRKLCLITIEDLLRHIPTRHTEHANVSSIASLVVGASATLEGKIAKIDFEKTWKKRLNIARAELIDDTGKLSLVWFHQPYIARMLHDDDLVRIHGKVGEKNGKRFIANPTYEKISGLSWRGTDAGLEATYPETRGISSRWLSYHIAKTFTLINIDAWIDSLPPYILEKYHLPSLQQSFRAIHFPKNEREIEAARKRLAFEEIFYIQLIRMRERMTLEEKTSLRITYDKKILKEFLSRLPFTLTKTQSTILATILEDLSRATPMARLLEGDVGSGKTIIAAAAAYMTAHSEYQSAYMSPTEILARQHFETFCRYIGSESCKIGLLVSSEARVYPSKVAWGSSAHIPKSQLLRWLASGEIKILIGTHALLSEKIVFKKLASIVVDEQHRFGISQRSRLAHSKSAGHNLVPHFLSMTATPIPRTLALTIFGDLDLAVLDETPPGKALTMTEILIRPKERAWNHIRKELNAGRQAFIICPRIEHDEEKTEQKSVKEEYEKISRSLLPEYKAAMLHGKMTSREKEKIMNEFRDNKIKILVSTSLVEVGIDIPNATIMVVEGAERFGLAQLHQLRGRIGRGAHTSYFYAVTDSSSHSTRARLKALKEARNGFELAEYDLQLRGPGELVGRNQWGISDLGMEALKNIKMVEAARTEARNMLTENRELQNYPRLQQKLLAINRSLYHFE